MRCVNLRNPVVRINEVETRRDATRLLVLRSILHVNTMSIVNSQIILLLSDVLILTIYSREPVLSSKFDSFHVRWLLLQTVPPISKSIEIDSSQPRERNYDEERTIHSGAASSRKRESHAIGVNRKARYEQRLVDAPVKRMHSPDRPVNCTPWAIDQ